MTAQLEVFGIDLLRQEMDDKANEGYKILEDIQANVWGQTEDVDAYLRNLAIIDGNPSKARELLRLVFHFINFAEKQERSIAMNEIRTSIMMEYTINAFCKMLNPINPTETRDLTRARIDAQWLEFYPTLPLK
jgi:hypothetical protein